MSDESWTPDVAIAEIERRYTMDMDVRTAPTPSPQRPRGWIVAAAAFVLVIAIGIVVALTSTSGSDDVVDDPTTTTTQPATTTTVAAAPDEGTVRAAIVSYVDAIDAGDAQAALASFALTDDSVDHPRAVIPENLTEFLVEIDWTITVGDDCGTGALGVDPGETALGCALVVDSPVHVALGVEGGVRDDGGFANHDQINLWHSPDAPVAVRWFLDRSVRLAYIDWTTTNDPDGFAANCDPALDGNYTEQYAYYEGFIHTAQCAAYLNSITPQVVAAIEAGG
jgi:hypothetical protein